MQQFSTLSEGEKNDFSWAVAPSLLVCLFRAPRSFLRPYYIIFMRLLCRLLFLPIVADDLCSSFAALCENRQ